MTIRKSRVMIAVIVVALIAAAIAITRYRVTDEPIDGGSAGGELRIQGASIPFTVKKFAKKADLVIRGVPVADDVHAFTSNAEIPDRAKSDEMYQVAGYHDMRVEVAEYIKGTGPDTISIRRLEPPEGFELESTAPVPAMGQEQVFFLEKGTGLWTGGYLVMSDPGLAPVVDEVVKLKLGGDRPLPEFRKEVKDAEKEQD